MKFLQVDTVEEARAKLLDCAKDWRPETEEIQIEKSLGRFLAEDLYSSCDLPAFNRATVDGYAVSAGDTAGAGESIPVFLDITGQIEMGKKAPSGIRSGQCMAIPTGGMLPEGADAVVMVEYSEIFDSKSIAIYEALAPGMGIVHKGEDIEAGSLLLRRGTQLRSQEAGILAAAGITKVSVYKPITMTIISTGDELIPPGQIPHDGEIRDINTSALLNLAQDSYLVTKSLVLPDEEEVLGNAVAAAMKGSSIVVVSGGSSQGEKDATARVFSRYAKPGVLTHGLAIKPGKPTILAYDAESKTILAGLPGHPVSAMMVFQLLLIWLADRLMGERRTFPVPARISCNIAASPGKTNCQPVTLHRNGTGFIAEPVFGKSGMISTLTRADGYIIIDINKEGLKKDETVLVHLF